MNVNIKYTRMLEIIREGGFLVSSESGEDCEKGKVILTEKGVGKHHSFVANSIEEAIDLAYEWYQIRIVESPKVDSTVSE